MMNTRRDSLVTIGQADGDKETTAGDSRERKPFGPTNLMEPGSPPLQCLRIGTKPPGVST